MSLLSVLVPTRDRPEKVTSVVAGALDLARRPDEVEFLFYLDHDDAASEPAIRAAAGPRRWQVVRGERLRDQSYWNRLADRAAGEIFFLGADDLAFRTTGWDELVRDGMARAARGGVGMVYGHDGDFGPRLATHPFVTRRWKEVVGFFVPPYFERCFVDLWIFELAVLTGLFAYLPDLFIEHMHVELAKAPGDSLYEEIRKRPFPHGRYADLAPERLAQARALLAAAGVDRRLAFSELFRRRADAPLVTGGKWFVWP